MHTICTAFVLNIVINVYLTDAYAQLADTMLCADKECSETISEGKARLAYRPRDDKFLNLEKGDVVLVKSKNAGKKSHLWGGQVMGSDRFGFFPSSFIKEYIELVKKPKYNVSIKEFLKIVNGHKSPDLYAGLIGENQRITVDKSKKKKSTVQSDSVKKDVEDVNPSSSSDAGSAGAKTDANGVDKTPNKPVDGTASGVDDSATKQEIPHSSSKVEDSKPIEDQPLPEPVDEERNVKATTENEVQSSQTVTTLPPHIAAIMEESLRSSEKADGTQYEGEQEPHDSADKNEVNIAPGEDTSRLVVEAQRKHSDEEDSPDSDAQAVQPDRPTEAKEHLSDGTAGNSIDSDGMKMVHEKSTQGTTTPAERERNDLSSSAVQPGEPEKTTETKEPLVDKEDQNSSDEMKSITDDTQETLQDGPSSSTEMKLNEDTHEPEESTQDIKSIEDVKSGNMLGVSSADAPETEEQGQGQTNGIEVTPNSEFNSKPDQAESVNGSSNDIGRDDEKTREYDMTKNQGKHDNLQSDGSHSSDDEGSYKLSHNIEEENLDSKAEPIDEDDGPFEDDTDDDFEIEYLVVSRKEKNIDEVVKPQVTEDIDTEQDEVVNIDEVVKPQVTEDIDTEQERDESNAQEVQETQDRNIQTDHTKHPEPEHLDSNLDNETVADSEKTDAGESTLHSSTDELDTGSEAGNVQVSDSELDKQAKGQISKVTGDSANTSEEAHEEASSSAEKLMVDATAQESNEKVGVPPIAEGETAKDTDFTQPDGNIKTVEEKQEASPDSIHTQSEESRIQNVQESQRSQNSPDNSVERSVVDSTSQTTDLTDGISESNDGSGSDEMAQINDIEVEDIPVDSQLGESELTGEGEAGSIVNEDKTPASTDDISVWNITEQEKLTEPPKTDSLPSAGDNDIMGDNLKSGLDEAGDSQSTRSSDGVTAKNAVGTEPTSDNDKKVEPPIDTDNPQSSSEVDRITLDSEENPDDGGEKIDSEDSGGVNKLASEGTKGNEQSQMPKDDLRGVASQVSRDGETSTSDERNTTRSEDPVAVDKSGGTAGVSETARMESDGNTESAVLKTDLPSNVDEVGGEEEAAVSQETSQVATDGLGDPESPDKPKQEDSALHKPDIPPPGPPPKSFSVVENNKKLTVETTTEDPNKTAQSQSESTVSEVQDLNDTMASVSNEEVLDKKEDSSEKVLQLDSMSKGTDAKSEKSSNPDYMEQLGDNDESETGKHKVLHEGKLVDWDETIEEKSKDDQPLTWDEAIGDDAENVQEEPASEHDHTQDHEVQCNPTPLQSEVDETTPEDVTVNTIPEDVVKQQIETTQPPSVQDIVDEQQVEATQRPSLIEPETEKSPEGDISAEPQVTQDVTVSPPNLNLAEDGASDSAAEAIDERLRPDDLEDLDLEESMAKSSGQDGHEESFWLRIIIVLSNIPGDIVYICEPLLEIWVSLLPPEYQNDVFGVSWPVIFVTFFVGFALICLLTCRSRSAKGRMRNELAQSTIEELRTQLENLSKEKIDIENDLRTKQNEIEIQQHQMSKSAEDKDGIIAEKTDLENTLHQFGSENENLKRHIQELSQVIGEKDDKMQQMIANAHQAQERLQSQEQVLVASKDEIKSLQASVHEQESMKKDADTSVDKLKERIKNLEKSKGEIKKEGKVLKDQIDKLNDTIGGLQQRLDAELEDGEQRRQENDVLKDCILQFKGAKEFLADDDENIESEESLEKQKEKMKAMVDVANIKKTLRHIEGDKLQITYELEAEKENRIEKETKVTELEAVIQGDEVVKSKLQRDIQTLESKLAVMQEFYAKREVEIQSKLGLEKSRLEYNTSLLENKESEQSELLSQLHMYKQMCEEAKQKYDGSERKHKQEVVGFEKRAHDNWLACREAERKYEEATKQINRLQLEMGDVRIRLRDSERDLIIRPRPERHGPPGGPPPFGPPRRHMPPGSPIHFRNAPPNADRRSPPPHRRPPSPGGSIPGDRPPSRPDRPPSTHSLPPMDRRPPSGPPLGPGHPYGGTPGRPPYRDGPHPTRPPPRDLHPHGRPPSGPVLRTPSGPMTSSPYMERPPIPPSHSPRAQAFMQSSLHATPPQPPIEGLRTDGHKASLKGAPLGPPPNSNTGGGNPFRRSKS